MSSQSVSHEATLSFFFIWLFTVAIYARPEDIFPPLGQFHLTFVLGMLAAAAFLWSLLFGNVSLEWPRELQIVLLLTVWFMVGMPFAYWRGGSFEIFTQVWLKTLLIFFLMTQTLVSLERIRSILWAIILSELVVTAYSIAASTQVRWVGQRMYGVSLGILGWNFLGIAAAISIPYIAAIFITQPSFLKSCVLAAATVSMFWMLVLTASRSGILNVIVSVILTSILVLRGSSRGKAIGLGLVLCLLIAVGIAPKVFWERMETMSADDSSGPVDAAEASAEMSENNRMDVLMRSIVYTFEHPVFGLGLGNLGIASGNDLRQPDAWVGAHNTFTEISSEAGLPALLLFLALLAGVLRTMRRIGQSLFADARGAELSLMARASMASLLSFIFGALFAHLGYDYFLYTCPLALSVGIERIARNTPMVPEKTFDRVTARKQQLTPGWTA